MRRLILGMGLNLLVRRLTTVMLVTALLPMIGCLAPSATDADEDARSGRAKVWLIGWDGMAPWIVVPMLKEGKLPNLKRLADSGCIGMFETVAPAKSPCLWTTIATGKTRADHGVFGFWKEDPETGVERLYSVQDRRAAPLWRIADDAGLSSVLVGWWVTWPAEEIRGAVVSDRFAASRWKIHPKQAKAPTDQEWLVSPPELEQRLEDCLRRPSEVTADALSRFVSGPVREPDTLELHDPVAELTIAFARDETHWCAASRLVAEESPDLLAIHIQGTDIVNHYFLKYRFPDLWKEVSDEPIDEDESRRFRNTIDAYYSWQDRRLGELLELADSETVVFVLSDHGFRAGPRPRTPSISGVHGGAEAPPGLLVVSGAGIRSGHRLWNAHVLDIAPTVLALWNLPIAHDQPGRVLRDAMVLPPDVGSVASYGAGASVSPTLTDLDVDQEIIRSLKALGYAE